ncbi:MAG: mechanosensitive ion channel family protein, partial [Planctomycetota bacterium]
TAVLVGLCIVMVLAFLLAFDVLRDVAGSLQLLAAAPFDVGHVVEVDGIVGIVRRIGLRTTALETPERTLVVIPNQQMVRHPVENYTRRTSRRYSYTLELAADTRVSALKATVEAINELLLAEPLVMRRAPKLDAGGDPLTDGDGEVVMQGTDPLVAIEAIEDGAIELLVQYDLTEVSVPKAAPVQQNLVLGVLGALESNGVQFANGSAAGADDTASRADGAATTTTSTATKSASKKATPAAKKKTTPLAKNKSKTTPLKASKSKTMPASPKKRTVTRKTADAGDDDAFV